MHLLQFFLQLVKGVLEGRQVELKGRDLLPVWNFKHLQDVADVISFIKSLSILVWVELEDVTDFGEVLDVFLSEGLLAEIGELFLFVQRSEVLEVDACLHQVNHWLHGFEMDLGQDRVGRLRMLDILLFKILQLRHHVLLPTCKSTWLKEITIVTLLDVANYVHELFLAVEMVLVGRVGHLSLDLINLDEVCLHTLEHHRAEDRLLVGCKITRIIRPTGSREKRMFCNLHLALR